MKSLFAAIAVISQLSPTPGNPLAQAAKTAVTRHSAAKSGLAAAHTARTNPIDKAQLVYIPAGEFPMGDNDMDGIKPGNPAHIVKLSAYWMYKDLVTVGQYQTFCRRTGRKMPQAPKFNPSWRAKDQPIANVTWADAIAYARWAHADLPTEAQWEKAARGTQGRRYPWGDTYDISMLWGSWRHYGDAQGTHKVGELGISPYGCTDMAGNVWQWCKDWYAADFWTGGRAAPLDPVNLGGGEKRFRVLRGGSWGTYTPDIFRTAYRGGDDPAGRYDSTGFRCVVRAGSH